ncbi:hypothetical protein ACLB2K_006410 [Fragaria x ananassa]
MLGQSENMAQLPGRWRSFQARQHRRALHGYPKSEGPTAIHMPDPLSGGKTPPKGAIEDAILEAEQKGVKVISLGLFNQGEGPNSYGGIYVQRNPGLQIKVVDGSSLAVAVILNSIPKGTTQVLLIGYLTKVAYALAFSLCQRDIQVVTVHQAEYLKLTKSLNATEELVAEESDECLAYSRNSACMSTCGYTMSNIDKVWQATLRHGFQPPISKD